MSVTDEALTSEQTLPSAGFSLRRQWRLTRKELAETLRDRRTIITLVLMPVLVYPLLSIVFRQFLVGSLVGQSGSMAIIAVEDHTARTRLSDWMLAGEHAMTQHPQLVEPPLVQEPQTDQIRFEIGNAEERLEAGQADVAVRLLNGEDPAALPEIEIIYPEQSPLATGLRSYLERRLRAYNAALQITEAERVNSVPRVEMVHRSVHREGATQSLLPVVIPLILLLMTITGAVYPAIDLTAGERERGTLEALMAAPVSRVGILAAKYVAVLTVALLTGMVNLTAMSITIYSAGLSNFLVTTEQSLPFLLIQVFGLLILFAGFFSAVLLAVTSFAKSFKEAQAYLIPLMLVTLGPGLLSLSPALSLEGPLAVMPLVNVVLLARDVFSGGAAPGTILVVVVSTVLYAGAAIALAARVFGGDAILYGSGGNWSELFRRPRQPRTEPDVLNAVLVLAVVFAAMINLGGAGSLMAAEESVSTQLLFSALITTVVFAGIPCLAARMANVSVRPAFRFHSVSPRFWLAAVLLGMSLGTLVIELTALGLQSETIVISDEIKQTIARKVEELRTAPTPLVLLCLALIPAVTEELFFRGYLLSAARKRTTATVSVILTSTAFALFHTLGVSGITLERTMPSLLLGLALGTLALKSGSVWPGMVLHTINNSLLLLLVQYKDWLVERQIFSPQSEHVPPVILAVVGMLAIAGMVIVVWPGRDRAKLIAMAEGSR